ncbi:rhomboid-like protein 11, chloroplastic isoform X1 [Papaver somniferum]|uniref:rhomboid-like protein 11, chloroplastic isoform X1 n=1 Tax=Papaver somniferum TaxID=3469 RepID=UPI000E7014C2|nr:rhomboid-like protein 11, chloroplastic isoform X1 [Papaver somniferum]
MFKEYKSHSNSTCFVVDPGKQFAIWAGYVVAFDQIARAISFRSLDAERRFRSRFETKVFLSIIPLAFLFDLAICEYTQLLEFEWPGKKLDGVNGIYWILAIHLGIYAVDYLSEPRLIKALKLDHSNPVLYQFVTAGFCHSSWRHLITNLFYLLIYGKLVEEEVGSFALWVCYILTGVGGFITAWLILPKKTISVGASDAVYGLFAISLFVKMHFEWTVMLEKLVMICVFVPKVWGELKNSGLLDAINNGHRWVPVGHFFHVAGALTGLGLVCFRARYPEVHHTHSLSVKRRYISLHRSRLRV